MFAPQSTPVSQARSNPLSHLQRHMVAKIQTIVIENDGLDTPAESIIGRNVDEVSAQEILDTVLNAGIVGLGNATFPTHVKLSPPADKVIEAVILNGAECEPYLTADHRLMVEEPDCGCWGIKTHNEGIRCRDRIYRDRRQ